MRTGKKTEEHDSEVVNYAYHFSVISHFDSSGKCYTRLIPATWIFFNIFNGQKKN